MNLFLFITVESYVLQTNTAVWKQMFRAATNFCAREYTLLFNNANFFSANFSFIDEVGIKLIYRKKKKYLDGCKIYSSMCGNYSKFDSGVTLRMFALYNNFFNINCERCLICFL